MAGPSSPELAALALLVRRHKGPGPHPNGTPQAVHGGAALPAGWDMFENDYGDVRVTKGNVSIVAYGRVPSTPVIAKDMARRVDPLITKYPTGEPLSIEVAPFPSEHIGGETHDDVDGSSIMLNRKFWDQPELMAQGWRDAAARGWFSESAAVDPIQHILSHEYGHALWNANTHGRNAWSGGVGVGHPAVQMRHVVAPNVPLESMWTGYGQTGVGEAFAEGFAAWAMRDVADPFPAARRLAELEGWP